MKCPASNHSLTEKTVDGISVDVCQGGCGRIWFDQFGLKKLDEPHEHAGEELLEVERDGSAVIDSSERRHCPKCEDTLMLRRFFSVNKQVEIDECQTCAGFWLDDGELAGIRAQFDSEAERHADAYFEEIFGSQLSAMRAESEAELEKARQIAKIF